MMITGFESYTLDAWSDVDGLMTIGKVRGAYTQSHVKSKRSAPWSVSIPRSLGVASLAVSAFLFSAPASAVAVPSVSHTYERVGLLEPPDTPSVVISPLRDINRGFNKLFDSVRAGESLIPSENVRSLAQKALQSQKEVVELDSWARKLAESIKDAKD